MLKLGTLKYYYDLMNPDQFVSLAGVIQVGVALGSPDVM